jgi:hypothetical protein
MQTSRPVEPDGVREAWSDALTFTPAEWRQLLEDPSFLVHRGNSDQAPRRLAGLPVMIVPDHGSPG